MPQDIRYSDGRTILQAVVVVWEDWHNERSGFFRAYWAASPDATTGSPVIGYCSPGGSHRTIQSVAREVLKLYPGETVYRNGRVFAGAKTDGQSPGEFPSPRTQQFH